ncbi:hypothetical protein Pcinc_033455 [Petrolisthes cinctipes]|uniref:UTP--glucose-1-phosphate uridylyltransferase n=1 Tax=Petrolisthes cinctipes TaxID=88211 RepID=A0AAE1K1U1_PETCI|nr:hypothetical protein Pcinc_033455 [Petrolisthes cinctipes]
MATKLSPLNQYSHQRRPSAEFKHLTKQEAQGRLTHDLEKLLHTCPTHLREATQRELEGFEKLFARFIYESSVGASINWDKIERLDQGSRERWGGVGGGAVKSIGFVSEICIRDFKLRAEGKLEKGGRFVVYGELMEAGSGEILRSQLNKLVVVKLNGGLGTSMGCKGQVNHTSAF